MPAYKAELPAFEQADNEMMRISKLADYLIRQKTELDYLLAHLDGTNLNGAGFSLTLKGMDGITELGGIGVMGGGIGLQSGVASVSAGKEGAVMSAGLFALRVTEQGIEVTEDGGESWSVLKGGAEA